MGNTAFRLGDQSLGSASTTQWVAMQSPSAAFHAHPPVFDEVGPVIGRVQLIIEGERRLDARRSGHVQELERACTGDGGYVHMNVSMA